MEGSSRGFSRAHRIVYPGGGTGGCGSEVPPVGATLAGEHGDAWRDGWEEGCAGAPDVAHSKRLTRWEDPRDRLDYYRGRRAGEEECGRRLRNPRERAP